MSNANRTNRVMRHWGSGADLPDEMDCTPIAMPADAQTPESLESKVARFFQQHLAQQRDLEEGPETWEESNDFEEEDPDTLDFSPYQFDDMAPPEPFSGSEIAPEDSAPYWREKNAQGSARALTDAENRAPDSPKPPEEGAQAPQE